MNEHLKSTRTVRQTQAAEGLPRWRWTLAEFERFVDLSLLGDEDRVELIQGELVPMSAKVSPHEDLRAALLDFIVRNLPADCMLLAEPGWRAAEDVYIEPDFLICPAGSPATTADPKDARLLVEIADTSWAKDIGTKALTYAAIGVRDYWVVNAETLVTRVHQGPSATGFETIYDVPPSDTVTPLFIAKLAVSIGALQSIQH